LLAGSISNLLDRFVFGDATDFIAAGHPVLNVAASNSPRQRSSLQRFGCARTVRSGPHTVTRER
jgi:hypothetical protein